MKTRRSPLSQVALGYLGITSLFVGVWAQCLPRAFYDRFPGFGIWVAGDGPYNEHLVRDVGGLNLSLAVLVWFAWHRPEHAPGSVVGWAMLVYAIPHCIYHSAHLHMLISRVDRISSLAGLFGSAACAVILLRQSLR